MDSFPAIKQDVDYILRTSPTFKEYYPKWKVLPEFIKDTVCLCVLDALDGEEGFVEAVRTADAIMLWNILESSKAWKDIMPPYYVECVKAAVLPLIPKAAEELASPDMKKRLMALYFTVNK